MTKAMISLVGDQVVPNLMGVVKFAPEHIFLMHTGAPRFLPLVENMKAYFGKLMPTAEISAIVVSATSPEEVREKCRSIAGAYGAANTLVNATGGTKLMAFGALQAGYEADISVFYVDTAQGKIISIGNASLDIKDEGSLPKLTVYDFLGAGGIRILDDATEEAMQLRDKLEVLAENVLGQFERWTETMKYLSEAGKTGYDAEVLNFSGPLKVKSASRQIIECRFDILAEYAKLGFIHDLKITANNICFSYPNKESHDLVRNKGKLLELLVFYKIKSMGGNDDVRTGVRYHWGNSNSPEMNNEIDVLVSRASRLYCIECKSGVHNAKSSELSQLKDKAAKIGGVFAQKVFVLNDLYGTRTGLEIRAQENDIAVIKISQLLTNPKEALGKILV